MQAALSRHANGAKVADVLPDYQLMNLLDALADAKGPTVSGIAKDRVSTERLNASLNLTNAAAYAKPGAAPNGADYVLLGAGRESGSNAAGPMLEQML